MTKWHKPVDVAAALQVKIDRVYGHIASGELSAVNVAERRAGRPRWRISQEALDQFLRSRQNVKAPPAPRQRRRPSSVTQYF